MFVLKFMTHARERHVLNNAATKQDTHKHENYDLLQGIFIKCITDFIWCLEC